jgi:hypothetical protein
MKRGALCAAQKRAPPAGQHLFENPGEILTLHLVEGPARMSREETPETPRATVWRSLARATIFHLSTFPRSVYASAYRGIAR